VVKSGEETGNKKLQDINYQLHNTTIKSKVKRMQFLGHYYHALEQKGRLAIPALFRKNLGKEPVLTRGLEGCLFLFPQTTWQEVVAAAERKPLTRRASREWVRLLTYNAQRVEFDAQGRILVPDHLRQFAGLTEKVVLAGALNRIEIWQQERYHTYLEKLEGRAEEIAEAIDQTED